MNLEMMAPMMFAGLLVMLLIGYPVAFALAANGILFAFIGIHFGMLEPVLLQALPERIFGIMGNQTLLAIPFFTFMGIVLERSGMAEDLLDTIGQLFGPIRGGVAYAVVFVGALLAATTGVVSASVIAMGLISMPIMLRYGYSKEVTSGVICASGTLAQILPPSLVLIVLADVLGTSVGDMYRAAMMPGLMLTGLLMLYIFIVSIIKPESVPALPPEARTRRGMDLLSHVMVSLVPPLFLIFIVLGTLFAGIATPTEGGAMGAVGAMILAMIKRRFDMKLLWQAMEQTTRLTSFVMFILVGSTIFALTFRAVDGDLWVEHLMSAIPGGVWGFLLVVNLLVFILGFFIDFFEIAFILLPLLAPVADKLGIDLVWFGILIALNMQTSFLTPPFGFALFYLRSVAPSSVSTLAIYRGVVPFIIVQLIMLAVAMVFPQTVTFFMDGNHAQAFHDPKKSQIFQDQSAEDTLKLLQQNQGENGGGDSWGGGSWDDPPAPAAPPEK